jgi:hypothetical protein
VAGRLLELEGLRKLLCQEFHPVEHEKENGVEIEPELELGLFIIILAMAMGYPVSLYI